MSMGTLTTIPMGTRCEELGRPAGGRGAFLPMVVESFGGWHEVAEREVRKLGPATLTKRKARQLLVRVPN